MTRSQQASFAENQPAWDAADLRDDPHGHQDKAARVKKMFTAIAPRYDLNNRLHSFGRDQAWRRCAVRFAAIRQGDDILDVACGTGDLTELFTRARPSPRSVTGIDFTERMLLLAREKADGSTRPPGAPAPAYQQGDAMNLPCADGAFDVVSIAFGLRNISDPQKALREFRRVLRPGGRLVILEFDEPTNPLLRWGNRLYCRHIMPWTATLVARDRSGAYRYLPRSIETFLDRDAMRSAIKDAGFHDIQQHPLTFGVCVVHVGRAE